MARLFFSIAIVCIVLGLMWHFGYRVGSLPGDISVDRGNTKLMLPIASCILISLLMSLVGWMFRRFSN